MESLNDSFSSQHLTGADGGAFGRYGSNGSAGAETGALLDKSESIQAASRRARPGYTSQSVAGDSPGGGPHRRRRLPIHRRYAYGMGHVFNDMCASMWFTYLLVFYHFVVRLPNTYAGTLLLIGQVFDAAATPVVGYLCDVTRCRYGRRKIWHLAGTIMVALSLFFFWHKCLPCHRGTHIAWLMLYYSVFIILFQWGWAMVQISHLSLIPELTEDANERVGLNAIR